MITIAIVSLSGGQGKTTTSLFLGKRLALMGQPTLLIDADPQHNLSTYLGGEVADNSPTLLELLKNSVELTDTIYPVVGQDNLYLIPADDKLDGANDYLSSSGAGALMLERRLNPFQNTFKVCLIDSPPQRSQICLSVVGAADYLLVPVEATVKGFGSLVRTVDLWKSLKDLKVTAASLLGVIPFRDRWIGITQSKESQLSVNAMKDEVGETLILPSIRESERYKQAINQGKLLGDMGFADLEYPFDVLVDKIKELV